MRKMIIALCLAFTAAALGGISEKQVRKETVQNGKIGLATRLILPDEPLITPPPVLIIVHGSGKDATWPVYKPLVERLVQSGFGVAFFDKRGTGESSGRFLNISVKKSTEVFGQLSSDVVAVAEWVAEQPGIDKHRIGLFGLSQGGWIVPLAANKTELISYSVILSGPVASLGQEKLFSNLAGDEKRDSAKTLEEVDQAMEEFSGAHGFDSSEEIERMEIPSFWLFGENDRSMPVRTGFR